MFPVLIPLSSLFFKDIYKYCRKQAVIHGAKCVWGQSIRYNRVQWVLTGNHFVVFFYLYLSILYQHSPKPVKVGYVWIVNAVRFDSWNEHKLFTDFTNVVISFIYWSYTHTVPINLRSVVPTSNCLHCSISVTSLLLTIILLFTCWGNSKGIQSP